MTCIYCTVDIPKTEAHFICDNCTDCMCDECYSANTEPIYHCLEPIKSLSLNMLQAIREKVSEGDIALKPTCLCDRCETDLSSYVGVKL